MGLAAVENQIVQELRQVTGNQKITKSWLMEWSTGPITPQEGEELVFLPTLQVHCAIKQPAPKSKKQAIDN